MGLLDLFIAASMPVLKVLLITALGLYLALDPVDILGEDARKHLNKLVFYVLNPSLVATNLDRTITYRSVIKLWFMPINILITFIIGSILGWLVIQITGAPQHIRGLIVGCSAAGNLGNLLLIIIPAVCKEKGSPFGAPDTCRTYGLAYASLSMAIGSIYIWTYVYNIMRISSRSSNSSGTSNGSIHESFRKSSESDLETCSEPELVSNHLKSEDDPDQYVLLSTTSEIKDEVDANNIKKRLQLFIKKTSLKKLFAPSTIAVIFGLVIGLVPQIRMSLIGDEAPLRVIQDSASILGDASIPSLTLIIGGNLLGGLQGSGVQISIIISIIISRYIFLPLSGILIIKGAIQLGLVQYDDSLYQFVLLIQYALPPAMNIGTITQLLGTGEKECSVIMLWTYVLASISLTFWSTFYMWLLS